MDLLSEDERQQIKSSYEDFFETFRKEIVVHKASEIVVSDINLSQVDLKQDKL